MKTSIMTTVLAVLSVLLRLEVAQADLVNVALGKPTQQIDTSINRVSSFGTDGDPSPYPDKCAHTLAQTNTWWIVDLLYAFNIYTIRIISRYDFHSYRLREFYVYASMVNPLPIPGPNNVFVGKKCLSHPGQLSNNGLQTLNCIQPVTGRYVYVFKPRFEHLTLCEFEVLADVSIREMSCTISRGQKSLLPPNFSKYLTRLPSFAQCLVTCQTYTKVRTNLIQLNAKSGKCDCIKSNNLVETSSSLTSDQDFNVCQLDDILLTSS